MSDNKHEFTKDEINTYLSELAKKFKKLNGTKMPGEIIIVGGAAILLQYDIDGIIKSSSVMRDAINFVADKYDLPRGWLNTDFTKTKSYSPGLYMHSKYYRTFSNILEVRIINPECLIAMKLVAGRNYKYDYSDIIGILKEQQVKNEPISYEQIVNAVEELYGPYDTVISQDGRNFLQEVFESENLDDLYNKYLVTAMENKKNLTEFEKHYPGVLNEENLSEIMNNLHSKDNSIPSLALEKDDSDYEIEDDMEI